MKSRFALLLSGFLLVLTLPQALAAVPLASPEQDRSAKQAMPPTGKALIYVYRLEDAGSQAAPGLWLNKRDSGHLEPQTYGMWAAGPGRLEVRAGQVDAKPLTINCEAGRIYFIQMTVRADGSATLRQVPYGTGRTEMSQAHLVLDPAIAARVAAAPPKPVAPAQPPAPAPAKATTAAPAAQQAQAPEEEPAVKETSGLTLILKGGSFQLANSAQTIDLIPPVDLDFSSASMAYGLEGEWRIKNGFAFGLEVFGESEDYTITGSTASGQMSVTNVFFNAKKYFRQGSIIQPYVGAGIGAAATTFSGPITGSAGGLAIQAMAGVVFRWQKVGLYTEFKYEHAEVEDAGGAKVDVSGSGLFAGLSVYF
jgi:hypothetical protein